MYIKQFRLIEVRIATLLLTLLAVPACITMFASCIMEERTDCPCRLSITEGTDKCIDSPRSICLRNDSGIFLTEEIKAGNLNSFPFSRDVPKGYVRASVSTCRSVFRDKDGIMRFTDGIPADTVRAHVATVDCTGDLAAERVMLQRQFVAVDLVVKGVDKPASCTVKTGCGALDLFSLKGLPGRWSCPASVNTEGHCRFHLPRLYNRCTFTVSVTDNDGDSIEYNLGKELDRSGYDWDAEILKDLSFGIDYCQGTVTVSTEPWKEGGNYNEDI